MGCGGQGRSMKLKRWESRAAGERFGWGDREREKKSCACYLVPLNYKRSQFNEPREKRKREYQQRTEKTGSKNSRPDHQVFFTEEELIMWAKGFIFSDGHV